MYKGKSCFKIKMIVVLIEVFIVVIMDSKVRYDVMKASIII